MKVILEPIKKIKQIPASGTFQFERKLNLLENAELRRL